MARDSSGAKNQPIYAGTGAPATGADLTELGTYAALVGNRKAGTNGDRTALTGSDRWDGLEFYETDTDSLYIYNGGWKLWNRGWQAYTPTLANVSGSPTVTARYAVAAGVVKVKVNLTLNGANFGTAPLVSLPVTARTPVGLPPVGIAIYNDVSATVWVTGTILLQTTTQVAPLVSQVAGALVTTQFNVSATSPFTWAASDTCSLEFEYEAA